MAKIKIELRMDEHECDTCGCSVAYGYTIYKDGEVALHREPIAHCYGSESYDGTQQLIDLCEVMGHELEIIEEYDDD